MQDGRKLVIVESPSKCAKIEHFLGPQYQCIASCGHIREIEGGLKGIDVAHNFQPTFCIVEDKKAHVKKMASVVRTYPVSSILLATDDDREGEVIAWHLCQVFGLPVETTSRIVFHEVTASALLHAVAHPRLIHLPLVHAQHARQVLDLIVGYTISPQLWRYLPSSSSKKSRSLSAGRCQTPALRLVYDHSLTRTSNTESSLQYRVTGQFFPSKTTLSLNHEFESIDKARAFLEASRQHHHHLTVGEPRPSTKSPPSPLSTSRLLQQASSSLHLSPKQTMALCQSLYQNGHITYMRTDSTSYAAPFVVQAAAFIQREYGIPAAPRPQAASNDGTHEAIRVTNLELRELPNDSKEAALYRFIWRTTVQSCMPAATFKVFSVRVSAPLDYAYTQSLEVPTSLGWMRVCGEEVIIATTARLMELQSLKSPVTFHLLETTASLVDPGHRSYYTEASLIQALEDCGIGRPSTFAHIVETIQDRGYVKRMDVPGETRKNIVELKLRPQEASLEQRLVEKTFGAEKNKLVIQPIGIQCIEFLIAHYGELFDYAYTRRMEEQLDAVSASPPTAPWWDMCRTCYTQIEGLSLASSQKGLQAFALNGDSDHELVIHHDDGPAIRRTDHTDGSVTYLPICRDIDFEKAKAGLYTLSELMQNGPIAKDMQRGALENAARVIPPSPAKSLLRPLTADLSIREGKYGPYLFYKTTAMKSAKFFPLKTCPLKWETAPLEKLMEWAKSEHGITRPSESPRK